MRGSIDLTVSRAGINVCIRDTTHQYFLQTNLENRGIPSQNGQFQQSRNMQSSSSQQSCYYSPSHNTSSPKQCHTEITIESNHNNKNQEDTKLQSTGSFQKGNENIHSRKYKKYNNRISQSEDLVNTYFQDPNQNDASEDGPSGSEKSLSSSDYDADDDDDIYTERNKLILSEKQKFKSLCDLKKTTEMNSEEKLKKFNKFLKEHNRSSSDHKLAQNIYGMNGDMNQKRKLCRTNNNRKILRQRHKRDCETSPQLALLFPMMSHGDCEVEDFPQKLKRCLNKSCHNRGQFLKKNCKKATFLTESYEPEYKKKTLEDLFGPDLNRYGPDSNLPGINEDKFSNRYSKFIYRPEKNTRNNGNFIKKHPKLSVLSSYGKTESDNIHFQDDQRDHDYTSESSLQKHLEQQFKQWLKEHWGRGILKKSQQYKFTTSKEHRNTREGMPKKLVYNQPMYFLNKIRNQESDTPVVSTKMYVKNNEHKYIPISTESEEKPTEINRNQEDNYTFENDKYELPEPSLTFSSLSSSKEQETRNKLKHGNDKIDNIPLLSDTECERMGNYYSTCSTFQPINFKQESPIKTYNEQEQDSKLEDKQTSYSSSQKSGLPRLSYANFLKHFPSYKMINNRSTSPKTPGPFQSEPASYQITTKTSNMENPSILQQLNLKEIYQKLPSNFELSAGQWIHLQPSEGLYSHKTNANHRPENERELENNLLQYNMNSRSSNAPNNVTNVETKDDISETFSTKFNNNGGYHRLKSVPESDHMYMPLIVNKTENILEDILNNQNNAKQDFYNPESQVQYHDDTFDNSTSDVPHTSQENVPYQAIGKINNNMHGNNNTQPFAGNKEETVTEINLSIQIGKNITQDGREDNTSTQKTHESKPIKQNSKLTDPLTLLEESVNAEEKDLQNNAVNIQYTNKSNIYPSKFPSESQVSPDQNKEKPSNSTSESIIDLLHAMLESQKEAPMIDTPARYPSERILTSITDISSLTPTERNSFDFLDSGADDPQGSIQEENVIKDITSIPEAETQNNEDNRNIPQIYPIMEVNHQSYPEQIYKKGISPTTTTEHHERSNADNNSEKIPLLENSPQFNEVEYPTNNLPKFPHSTEATVHGTPEYSGTMLIIDPSTGAVTETIPVTGRLLMLSSKQGNDIPNYDDSNPLYQLHSHSTLPSNEQGKYTQPPYTAVIGNDFLYTIYPQENHNENIHFPQEVIHSAPETPFKRNEQNEFETPEKTDHSTETEDTTNNFEGKINTNSNDNYTTQIIPTTSPVSWFEKDYKNISIPKEHNSDIHSSSDLERPMGTEDQVSLSISPDVHVTCYKKDSHCEVAKNEVYSNFFTVMLQEMQKLGKENCSETCTGSTLIPACELCVKKLIEEKVSDEEIKSFAAQHCPKQEGIEDGSDIFVDKNSPAYTKCKYKFIADLTSFFSLWLKSITNSR